MSASELTIKVVPGASGDAVAGWLGDALKVRVSAPPEKGKANEAVVQLLAETLGIEPRRVSITAGHTAPRKRVVVEGLSRGELRQRIDSKLAKS